MRTAKVTRSTRETQIMAELNVDGTGLSQIKTPIPIFTHMLDSMARHSLFDLIIDAKGDLEVDQHHIIEDVGLICGQALLIALGSKEGIERNSSVIFPMDEALVVCALDLSGRAFFQLQGGFSRRFCGGFDLDLLPDFLGAFCQEAKITLHVDIMRGRSDHHKLEAIFKAMGKALKQASQINPRIQSIIPSTKGVL